MCRRTRRAFFRRWRVAILLGVLVVAVLVGFREFVDYRSDFPIVDPYLAKINEMSLQSPRARQRLEQYYAEHQRQTVASKHYPALCNEMQKLAAEDGVALSDKTSLACPMLLDLYEKP